MIEIKLRMLIDDQLAKEMAVKVKPCDVTIEAKEKVKVLKLEQHSEQLRIDLRELFSVMPKH